MRLSRAACTLLPTVSRRYTVASSRFWSTSAPLVASSCENIPLIEAVLTMQSTKTLSDQSPLKAIMKTYLLTLLCFVACSPANAEEKNTYKKEDMNTYKKDVTLWYEAFTKKDPALLDRILDETWVDIPGPPGTPAGPKGAKPLLAQLTSTFPDLKLTIEDILQDGNKVVVRARMAGTQKEAFMGFPSKNRKMDIQVVDIHEFKDGKIVRTWHTEDWMTGLHQLGVFDK
jgi:steroid delta-isomerase-like uncharacterized protein